jgi:hypothetical protein
MTSSTSTGGRETTQSLHPDIEAVLQHFEYSHLPPALQEWAKKFNLLAHELAYSIPFDPELMKALNKMLEVKDSVVRAVRVTLMSQGK